MSLLRPIALALVVALSGCAEPAGGLSAEPPIVSWPAALPRERPLPPPRSPRVTLVLDAGHGASSNTGNTSCFCVREQDFTQALTDDVAAYLEESGWFSVVPTRVGDERVAYAERVELAERAGADAFVSLHSDIRGRGAQWTPSPACIALRNDSAPGFSVLFSDEGPSEPLREARALLAASVADELRTAAFLPYDGDEYAGLYEPTGRATGAFVDRHAPDKRIFLLRRTSIPAVLVETHNALDPAEAERWEDAAVRRAFALALGRGVLAALGRLPSAIATN